MWIGNGTTNGTARLKFFFWFHGSPPTASNPFSVSLFAIRFRPCVRGSVDSVSADIDRGGLANQSTHEHTHQRLRVP